MISSRDAMGTVIMMSTMLSVPKKLPQQGSQFPTTSSRVLWFIYKYFYRTRFDDIPNSHQPNHPDRYSQQQQQTAETASRAESTAEPASPESATAASTVVHCTQSVL